MHWEELHRRVVAIGKRRAELEHEVVVLLLRAYRAGVWAKLGMATFSEYAERFVGLTPRQTEERLRVGRELERLPVMDRAFAEGRIPWTAVKEMTRVATAETEAEWVHVALGKTVGEVARLVSERFVGDRPSDPVRNVPQRQRVVLDLPADVYALWRDAIAALRKESPGISEEDLVALMARRVLGGPEAGRASYQIWMTVCEKCGVAEQDGRGASVVVDEEVAEMARCDAQIVSGSKGGKAKQGVPPATRREAVRRQHGRCAVPGCRNAIFNDVHHLDERENGGGHQLSNLILLCAGHHRAAHRGTLWIEGTWETGLVFRHADGSFYGAPASPRAGAMLGDLYQALVGMGFKQGEARSAVETVRPRAGADMGLETALRLALRVLMEPREVGRRIA